MATHHDDTDTVELKSVQNGNVTYVRSEALPEGEPGFFLVSYNITASFSSSPIPANSNLELKIPVPKDGNNRDYFHIENHAAQSLPARLRALADLIETSYGPTVTKPEEDTA